ncbi:MAG: ATP-binding cassette domain-containing protein [Gemmataceae bacterium]|nr:ATP-binding cassette domain-containing protein [Gemmataceae bacterium]
MWISAPHDDPDHGGHHGPSPIVRLLRLLKQEKRDVWVVTIYAIAVGILSLAVPLTAMAVVNTVAMATLTQQLLVLCVVLFVCLVLAALIRILQTVVVEYLQQRVFAKVVADLAYRLPRVELKAFDDQHGPELVNRFFDVLTVQKAAATLLLDGITVALQTLIGLILLAAYHEALLGFDVFLIASLVFIVFVLGRGGVRTAIDESLAKYRVASWMEELARNPIAFKLGGGPKLAIERGDQLVREYLLARHEHFGIVLRQFGFTLLLQASANALLLAIGGYLVIQGQLTLGQLVAAEIVVTMVVTSFPKLGKQLESYYDLLAAVDKLGHLQDLPLERATGTAAAQSTQPAAVEFSNVSFRYRPGLRMVLDRFSMKVAPGERVAIFGPNGAGKTTVVELLFGMRTPTDGHIQFDGQDLRDMTLESLREQVAVVSNLEVFEGSIVDNVRMGRTQLSMADVRDALSAVCLLDDVLGMPDGLQTRLTVGGRPLSLGQTERLMIARAIVAKPRLLVLDESLDAMDASVRERVLPTVLHRSMPWTLLVITHNEAVADMCDWKAALGRPRK